MCTTQSRVSAAHEALLALRRPTMLGRWTPGGRSGAIPGLTRAAPASPHAVSQAGVLRGLNAGARVQHPQKQARGDLQAQREHLRVHRELPADRALVCRLRPVRFPRPPACDLWVVPRFRSRWPASHSFLCATAPATRDLWRCWGSSSPPRPGTGSENTSRRAAPCARAVVRLLCH